MESERLILKLNAFMEGTSLKNATVEKEIGLPQNSLSNFRALKKELPKKWYQPIQDYMVGKSNQLHGTAIENKLMESLGDLKDKVTTANKIEVVERNQKEAMDEFDEDREQGKRLRIFAKQNKTDCDAIFSWLMDNYGKKAKTPDIDLKQGEKVNFHDFTQDKSYKKPYSPFNNPTFNAKLSKSKKQD